MISLPTGLAASMVLVVALVAASIIVVMWANAEDWRRSQIALFQIRSQRHRAYTELLGSYLSALTVICLMSVIIAALLAYITTMA